MFFLSGIREWTKRTVITRRKAYTWRKVTRFYIPITAHTDSVIHTLGFITFLYKIIHEYTHTPAFTHTDSTHMAILSFNKQLKPAQQHRNTPFPSQIPETKRHPLIQPTHGLITTHTRVHHNTHVQIHTTSSSTTHNPYTGSHKTHNPYKIPQTWDPPWSWLHTKHQPIHGFTHHSIPHGFTQNPTPTRLHTSSNPWGMEP